MKRYIYIFTLAIAVFTIFNACEKNDPIVFSNEDAFVYFSRVEETVKEGSKKGIEVIVVAEKGSPAIDVYFSFDTTGHESPAMKDKDFTLLNEDTALSFPDGWGRDTIWIQPVDNEIFTGKKTIDVLLGDNTQGYDKGTDRICQLKITDDEHPLKKWIGSYSVKGISYRDPGGSDKSWEINTAPDPENNANLLITGFRSGAENPDPLVASIDVEQMTITIQPGQVTGDFYGYQYEEGIFYGTEDISVIEDEPLTGSVQEDGTIQIDHFAIQIVSGSYKGYIWDVYNTTWTRTEE